jgi:glutamyl-Q tRNA(Asp) synthetase
MSQVGTVSDDAHEACLLPDLWLLAFMPVPVYRFAPSPNGELHLGHAYSALFTAEAAAHAGGIFLLRIEDIDHGRCRPQFAAQIFADLSWLGLRWVEPVRFQSEHMDDYRAARDRLLQIGVLYPCFCSRRDVMASAAAFDPEGNPLYPGTCRALSRSERQRRIASGAPYHLRIDMGQALARLASPLSFREISSGRDIIADPRPWGDVVLIRKDIGTSYHLSVVVDDALQSVTHVTRGMDLFAATHVHRLLQALLEFPAPLYHHHRLITDGAGRKLAKSLCDPSLRALREAGVAAGEIRRELGF